MLFPVRLLEKDKTVKDLKLPDGTSYIVTQKGFSKRVKTALFEYVVDVGENEKVVDLIEEVKPMARVFTKAIPRDMLRQIEAFFRKIYEIKKGEAVVLLYFHPGKKEWQTWVPKQHPQGMHVQYDPAEAPGEVDGAFLAASVHSHASAGAFHSGTDDKDEIEFDGLHITIGNVDKPTRTYAARWMLGKTVFTAKLDDVLDLEPDELPEVPDAWLKQVEDPPQLSATKIVDRRGGPTGWGDWYGDMGYDHYPIGMDEAPKDDKEKKGREPVAGRGVVADPFGLVHDFSALVEGLKE